MRHHVRERFPGSELQSPGEQPAPKQFVADSLEQPLVLLAVRSAMQQGKVPPPEAPLFSAFPEYADLADKDGRDRLTIQHVLTMTMGTDWDESSLFYADPRNSETAMECGGSLSLYSGAARRRYARRALDLLRRRNRFARAHDREGIGQNAA